MISFRKGFPIRRSATFGIFAPNRSFSQLVTSFFASWCLGIHLVLFLTWPLFNKLFLFIFQCLLFFRNLFLVFSCYGSQPILRWVIWSLTLKESLKLWWTWVDSNHRPHAYQACALTCWATGPYRCLCYILKNLTDQLGRFLFDPRAPNFSAVELNISVWGVV